MLISAVRESKSAICIHASPPHSHPSRPSEGTEQFPSSYLFYMCYYVCQVVHNKMEYYSAIKSMKLGHL